MLFRGAHRSQASKNKISSEPNASLYNRCDRDLRMVVAQSYFRWGSPSEPTKITVSFLMSFSLSSPCALYLLSFYSLLHVNTFPAYLGSKCRGISPDNSHFYQDGRIFYSPNHLGKRHAEAIEKPIEFDLSFTGLETALSRPQGQKPRVHSLGINPYSHSSE